MQVIEELEKIDDDCDKHGIQFVKIDDKGAAKEHGVKDVNKQKIDPSELINPSSPFHSFQPSFSSRSKSRIASRAISWTKMKSFTGF